MDTQLLRFSLFTDPSVDHGRQPWWSEVVGDEPTDGDENARERRWRQWGPVDGFEPNTGLLLGVSMPRVDWAFQPLEQQPEDHSGSIGELEAVATRATELIQPWLVASAPSSIARIAVGARVLTNVGATNEVNEALAQYVPLELPAELRDFRLRANLRGDVKLNPDDDNAISINRVMEWRAEGVMQLQLSAAALGPEELSGIEPQTWTIGIIEADVSTVVGQLEPPLQAGETLARLFELLLDEATRLSKAGFEGLTSDAS